MGSGKTLVSCIGGLKDNLEFVASDQILKKYCSQKLFQKKNFSCLNLFSEQQT